MFHVEHSATPGHGQPWLVRIAEAMPMTDDDWDPEAVVELPIDGTLDLHAFSPKDIKHLVPDYLEACRARGILVVRVVHGKGTGALRRSVHALLDRLTFVAGYRLADPSSGAWGATLVTLRESTAEHDHGWATASQASQAPDVRELPRPTTGVCFRRRR